MSIFVLKIARVFLCGQYVCLQKSERMCVFWIKSFTPGPRN